MMAFISLLKRNFAAQWSDIGREQVLNVELKFKIMENWIVRYYDKNDKEISSHVISERTEHEAENEAMADMPYNCVDWTMVATKTQDNE
jgi:hypothetical protein